VNGTETTPVNMTWWDRTVEWLNGTTTRKAVIPMYLILAVFVFGTVSRFERLADEQIRDVAREAAALDYTTCATRVETRHSLREVLIGITDLFPADQSAEAIRALIETEYPALELGNTCGHLLAAANGG
jgi:hypothetical protein